jgi:hypothetical protein
MLAFESQLSCHLGQESSQLITSEKICESCHYSRMWLIHIIHASKLKLMTLEERMRQRK